MRQLDKKYWCHRDFNFKQFDLSKAFELEYSNAEKGILSTHQLYRTFSGPSYIWKLVLQEAYSKNKFINNKLYDAANVTS